MKLKVEYIPIEELKPYANNAKLHPAEQIEQIKRSIQEFGFNDPIAVWKDNEIIEGHGRLVAASELGMDTIPIIRLDELSDEQRRAYGLVHNKLTMNSGFDIDLLSLEINGIEDIDMSLLGFEELDISYIDELLENDYAKRGEGSEYFSMSFLFPNDKKGVIEQYIKDNGKDGIVEKIIAEVENA